MENSAASPVPAVFSFDSREVRIVDRDGEPWFVAADVAAVLSVANTSDVLRRLDDDEKGVVSIDTLGGRQEMAAVNESGLYSMVLTSRKPEAKRFKKWVTSEVLPSIRKKGAYGVPSLPTDPMAILKLTFAVLENHSKELAEVKEQVQFLSDNVRLHQWQVYELKLAVTNKVLNFHKLSGVDKSKLFSGMWNKLKTIMQVSSYQAIPSGKFNDALEIVRKLRFVDMPDYVRDQAPDLFGGVA